jgi:hypothetical protein
MAPFLKLEANQPKYVVKCRSSKMIYQTKTKDGYILYLSINPKGPNNNISIHTFEVELLKQN